jgi:hypothetical protein
MNARALLHAVAVLAVAGTLGGCATRYDTQGNVVYQWQFGQDFQRDVDYTNPRLPLLPKWRPSTQLWPVPSPYEFNDLSRWSFLREPAPLTVTAMHVGDNAVCAACSDSSMRLALLAVRADARDGRRADGTR